MSARMTQLPSGLTVVTDAMLHIETAALGVWVGTGGRHEAANEHGISHFLEHMAFKGTKRRSAREIVEEIEAAGGDLNAATTAENTGYFARVLAADVPPALDVLADILVDPTFPPDEVEREKNVIVQEIGAAQDTPDDLIFEHLHELAYPDQPLGRTLLGTAASLKTFGRDTLHDYMHRHYVAPAMVIGAAGAVDHDRMVADVAERFGSFDATPQVAAVPARYRGGTRIVRRRLEQVHVVVGLEGVSQTDPALFSLQTFVSILGGGMSSRLFQEAREKRGLCYTIYAYHMPYQDTGLFTLYAGADATDTSELMRVIVDETRAAVDTLSEKELARAKAQMKAGLLMAMESCSSRAEQLARHVAIYGRPLTVAEIVARIDNVTLQSTQQAAHALLSDARPSVALLGAGRGLERAAKIAEDLPAVVH